jgi:hypothetical protein
MDRWRIYYADGSVFSDTDGSPWDAPRLGVECILTRGMESQERPEKDLVLISHSDYYYWEPDVCGFGWWHADQWAVLLHLRRARHPLVVFGEYTQAANYSAIEARALSDAGARKRAVWRGGPSSEPGIVELLEPVR